MQSDSEYIDLCVVSSVEAPVPLSVSLIWSSLT